MVNWSTKAARIVYAIEASGIADHKKGRGGKRHKIASYLYDKNRECYSSEKVDIIISEWMGYFLIYESCLTLVLSRATAG